MPRTIHGHKLTAKEHRQWKHVNATAGPAAATSVVAKTVRKRLRKGR